MIKKYNFTAYKTQKGRHKNTDAIFVSISQKGNLCFSQALARKLLPNGSYGNPLILQLFEDVDKRALAFKKLVDWKGMSLPENAKMVNPSKPTSAPKTYLYKFSIRVFLNKLNDCKLPANKLEITEYKDTDGYSQLGDLMVITIPRTK